MGLDDVREGIAKAALRVGRDPAGIHLIAVSKVQPEPRVRAVLDAGHRLFGENRVQEAQERWGPLRPAYDDISLHLIGPLQTNKARAAMDLFDAIHTVDELHDEGIGLHVINLGGQSMDTSTSMGRFFFQIVASFSELERGLISERTREGMAFLKDNHMRFTRSMYGWDVREDGGIKPNWKEQNHIDYMAWMMKDGMSAHSIARANNEKGKLGKNGGKWSSETVLSVTRNEYHRERVKFDAAKSWGTRVWQRRRRGDEKVEAKVVTEVWDKGDI